MGAGFLAIPIPEKGAANGVATLDATSLVPSSQLPSYVDDVLEFPDFATLPITGESGKIYITTDTGFVYRWSGAAYFQISSGVISSTDDVPEGINLYYTDARVSSVLDTQKGASNGIASLDASGDLALAQLPPVVVLTTGNQSIGGVKTFTNTTAYTAPGTGALVCQGGASIAGALGVAGTISGANLYSDSAGLTKVGISAGLSNTGIHQTATGYSAGYGNTGDRQTATGFSAGLSNTGTRQTATGNLAGYGNTGDRQTATGHSAGLSNTGTHQTATGDSAGYGNTGDRQTATGHSAGLSNTGIHQTATGYSAGLSNTGTHQTATGDSAGYGNTGDRQTATGYLAGRENTGNNTVFLGHYAGYQNTLHNYFELKHSVANSLPLIKGFFDTRTVSFADFTFSPAAAPTSATATGTAGEVRKDADYLYVCTATNTWKRAALSTW